MINSGYKSKTVDLSLLLLIATDGIREGLKRKKEEEVQYEVKLHTIAIVHTVTLLLRLCVPPTYIGLLWCYIPVYVLCKLIPRI